VLTYAIIFFVVALILGVFGFAGTAGPAEYAAQTFFFIFVVLFVVALVRRGNATG